MEIANPHTVRAEHKEFHPELAEAIALGGQTAQAAAQSSGP